MSRVINPETGNKERTRLSKQIVLALRELMRQTQPDEYCLDLASFISLALQEMYETIETTTVAWEKKGYWLKADRFRLEWEWCNQMSTKMRQAIFQQDWGTIALASAQIAQKLVKTQVPQRHHFGTPWIGAWKTMQAKTPGV